MQIFMLSASKSNHLAKILFWWYLVFTETTYITQAQNQDHNNPAKAYQELPGSKTLVIYSTCSMSVEMFTMDKLDVVLTRIKEHCYHIQIYHLEKSTLIEQSFNTGYCILLNNTIQARKPRSMDRIKQQ
jgi:hypothetical protein